MQARPETRPILWMHLCPNWNKWKMEDEKRLTRPQERLGAPFMPFSSMESCTR